MRPWAIIASLKKITSGWLKPSTDDGRHMVELLVIEQLLTIVPMKTWHWLACWKSERLNDIQELWENFLAAVRRRVRGWKLGRKQLPQKPKHCLQFSRPPLFQCRTERVCSCLGGWASPQILLVVGGRPSWEPKSSGTQVEETPGPNPTWPGSEEGGGTPFRTLLHLWAVGSLQRQLFPHGVWHSVWGSVASGRKWQQTSSLNLRDAVWGIELDCPIAYWHHGFHDQFPAVAHPPPCC